MIYCCSVHVYLRHRNEFSGLLERSGHRVKSWEVQYTVQGPSN